MTKLINRYDIGGHSTHNFSVPADGNHMDQGVRGAVGRRHAALRLGRAGRRAAVPGLRRRAQEEYPFYQYYITH